MGSVLLFDAARMQEIEDTTVVSGLVDIDGHLLLQQRDGTTIDAGVVKGDKGDTGDKGVLNITLLTAADTPASYPIGVSLMSITTIADWPAAPAIVHTVKYSGARTFQQIVEKTTGKMWMRVEGNSDNWSGWIPTNLDASDTIKGLTQLATAAQAIAGINANTVITPLTLSDSRGEWEGIVSADWTYGKPNVTLSDTSVVSAFLPANDIDVQPGSTVILNRTPGNIWTIVAVKNSSPQYLRQILLQPASGFRWYDAIPGDFQFISSTEAGPTSNGRYGPAYVTKSESGWVTCSGLFFSTAAISAGALITTLPVGFRPLVAQRFASPLGAITVNTNGTVVLVSAAVANSFVSLGNIRFNIKASTNVLTSFLNLWTDFGSPYGNARYGVDDYGFGFLAGAVKSGSSGSTNIAIWSSFPAGIGPTTTTTRHQPVASGTATLGGIYITNSGIQYMLGGNTELHLDGALWDTANAAIPWQNANLVNSWSNFNVASYPAVSFYKRPDGMVCIRGFANLGTLGSTAFILPEGYRPKHRIMLTTVSNLALGRLDIMPNGNVIPISGAGWFSFEGIMFAADH